MNELIRKNWWCINNKGILMGFYMLFTLSNFNQDLTSSALNFTWVALYFQFYPFCDYAIRKFRKTFQDKFRPLFFFYYFVFYTFFVCIISQAEAYNLDFKKFYFSNFMICLENTNYFDGDFRFILLF